MKNVYIHGDVVLVEIEKIPTSAKRVQTDERGIVLAEGEATGHYHAITEGNLCELYEDNGKLYLLVKEEIPKIYHQEHGEFRTLEGKTTPLRKGTYEKMTPREWNHFEEEIRRVSD